MIDLLSAYQPVLDIVLLGCGLALSQYVVLRAGVFSVGTAAFAAIGAYASALLHLRLGMPPLLCIVAGGALGLLSALLLSLPLARLRGTFQAIATLAMVQIVLTLALFLTDLTGGANGLNGIPKMAGTPTLLLCVLAIAYVLWRLDQSRTGYAFGAIRQDETAAVATGISVSAHQRLAFMLSGAIAGLTGALIAFHDYSLTPQEFGFNMLVNTLAAVVLGGSQSVLGPLAGATLLGALPELARPLAENRMVIQGVLLVVIIVYLPHGIVDSLRQVRRRRRAQGQLREATADGKP